LGQLEFGIYNDDHEAASVEQPGITVSMAIKYSNFLGKQVLVTLMKMIGTRAMVLTTATGLTSTKPMMQSPKLTTIFTLSLYPFPELTNLSLPKTKCNFLQHYFINTRYKGTYRYGMHGEWEDGVYPKIQHIPSGRRGSKQLGIGLPDNRWQPRSEMWISRIDMQNRRA
jgi:hypothetical protein